MGVTLERVQNKFACIIGELCSEPVVLSQFAIWLDLRLAEYKAKGAISLDCSGDNPDPVWLNGHRMPHKRSSSRDRRYGTGSPGTQPGEMSWSRISAERNSQSPGYDRTEPVVGESLSPAAVKTEPLDHGGMGAYPVSLHPHELPDSRTPPRKRSAAETISSEHELLSSGAKSRRLSQDPNSTADPSSNQSLMSIISGDVQDQDPETVDLTDSDMSMIMNYEDRQSTSQTSRGENSRPSYTSTPSAAAGSEFAARSDESLNTENWIVQAIEKNSWPGMTKTSCRPQSTSTLTGALSGSYEVKGRHVIPADIPFHLTNKGIRKRVATVPEKSQQIIGNMVNIVGMFGRWLWTTHHDSTPVEKIPAEKLDRFLAEFFGTIRRVDGKDYDAHRLSCMRSNLDRFLKENGYPYSITWSPEFLTSQMVLKQKRQSILSMRTNSVEEQANRSFTVQDESPV